MKVKKWLLGLVTFAAMVVICAVCAGAETYGDFEYSVRDDGTVEITDYNGNAKTVDIPETIDGKSATRIGDSAFEWCSNIESIAIPDSVTSIGRRAFGDCANLTNITIPNSVIEIGWHAFYDCASLKSITIPESVTFIGGSTFDGCTSLTSLVIPNSVTSIDDYAFSGCTSLTSITIPDNVTSIGDYVFLGCTSLTAINVATGNQNYVSVNGVLYNKNKTTIKCYPAGQKGKSYSILNSVIDIEDGAFNGCTNLTSITIPDSVTNIDRRAFSGCTNLTSITIPNGVTSIEFSTFSGCISLTNVTLSDSVTSIDRGAFKNCASLKNVTIPDSVTSIGDLAFGYYYDNNENKKLDGFKIYCYPGTAGEKYAKDNGFDYELIKAEKLANVTGFKVKSLTSTNVTLQWNKNTSVSGYEIEQYKGGKWVNVAKITSNATISYTVKGLAAGTAGYKFRMRAVKNGAYSDYTSVLTVNTNPYGVGGFKCSSKTSTSVTLKWNKGTTASGYQLQQYKDGKWVTIYTGTKATDTSYTVKKLKAGTAGYRFRIRAYKTSGGAVQYSDYVRLAAKTVESSGVSNVTSFRKISATSSELIIGWAMNNSAEGYIVELYRGGKWTEALRTCTNNTVGFIAGDLKAGATYTFRIRAYKTSGDTVIYSNYTRLAAVTDAN